MKPDHSFQAGLLVGMLLQQTALQQEVIEAQREIIKLREQVAASVPAEPGKDVHWHVASGKMSDEAAEADDLETVRTFYRWLLDFGKKYVQPYVHSKVYTEVINQMTRGLSRRIAELEVQAKFSSSGGSVSENNSGEKKKALPPLLIQ
ncbi:MAG TPA: hypothetical protein VHO69_04205 [Phototrophicaceae bacterium]|nr:hypothetical protein [Phototrophicaceae bacterium]